MRIKTTKAGDTEQLGTPKQGTVLANAAHPRRFIYPENSYYTLYDNSLRDTS